MDFAVGDQMNKRDLTYKDLLEIVRLVKSASHFTEFRLKVGDIEVEMKRERGEVPISGAAADAPVVSSAAEGAPKGAPSLAQKTHAANAMLVRAPMVGTVYRAPAPGAQPFVAAGDKVEAGTIVCIIEVMKLMNSIPAGHAGVVGKILFADAEMVEHEQVLMVIEPGVS